jgi:diguanylate cyclase (GGDEF)-like protein
MEHHLSRQAQRLQRLVRLRTQELTEANRRLQALSKCDGLTGVANRRHFDQVLEREWRRCLRRGEPLAVGLLDVDHFKAYNDRYGHLKGDETLRRVAQALQQVVGRAEDLVARYGGEEFAVILPGLDRREAALIAERLRSAIEALAIEHAWDGPEHRITISGGLVSRIPQTQGDHQGLVAAADQLLYAAKERGRNRVLVQALALDGDVSAAAS